MTAIATTMVFLGIRTSSPHSSAQRTLRPIPRIAQRPEPSEARTPALEDGGQFPDSVRTLWAGLYSPWGRVPRGRGEDTLSEDRSLEEMVHEVLMRQARTRAGLQEVKMQANITRARGGRYGRRTDTGGMDRARGNCVLRCRAAAAAGHSRGCNRAGY